MKIQYILILLAFGIWSCTSNTNDQHEEQVEVSETESVEFQSFGAEITPVDAIDAKTISSLASQESDNIKLTGEIKEVCQMKGCWLTMDIGNGETMRVTFKDYGFFVPKDSDGNKVIIQGQLSRELVSVETLQHYAEDAGKSADEVAQISEPEEKFTFVAEGVLIM